MKENGPKSSNRFWLAQAAWHNQRGSRTFVSINGDAWIIVVNEFLFSQGPEGGDIALHLKLIVRPVVQAEVDVSWKD